MNRSTIQIRLLRLRCVMPARSGFDCCKRRICMMSRSLARTDINMKATGVFVGQKALPGDRRNAFGVCRRCFVDRCCLGRFSAGGCRLTPSKKESPWPRRRTRKSQSRARKCRQPAAASLKRVLDFSPPSPRLDFTTNGSSRGNATSGRRLQCHIAGLTELCSRRSERRGSGRDETGNEGKAAVICLSNPHVHRARYIDPTRSRLLQNIVQQGGKALLLATHNPAIAEACDWIHEMKDSCITASDPRGTRSSIFQASQLDHCRAKPRLKSR